MAFSELEIKRIEKTMTQYLSRNLKNYKDYD